jgi:hypothetical protein
MKTLTKIILILITIFLYNNSYSYNFDEENENINNIESYLEKNNIRYEKPYIFDENEIESTKNIINIS